MLEEFEEEYEDFLDDVGSENARKIISHLNLCQSYIKEHVTDVFDELIKENPKEAVKKLPEFIDSILNSAGGLFKGVMCGGPHPGVLGPLITKIGYVYSFLDEESRMLALTNSLNIIDRQNYFLAQEYIEKIHNPWLARDILVNRALYWPGFAEYLEDLEECEKWSDFFKTFVQHDEKNQIYTLKAKSEFFLAFAVSRVKHCTSHVRRNFEYNLPELTDHTKDAIAALIDDHARVNAVKDAVENNENNISSFEVRSQKLYEQGVESRLAKYDPIWKDDLLRKIEEKKWILLEDTKTRYTEEYWKKR